MQPNRLVLNLKIKVLELLAMLQVLVSTLRKYWEALVMVVQ
jgi:hypothetical protein